MTNNSFTPSIDGATQTEVADIRGFFDELGVELPSQAGPELSIHCFADPYSHNNDDEQRSASLNIETSLWNCHGCGAAGNAYTAAVRLGQSSEQALALLRRYGLDSQPNEWDSTPLVDQRAFALADADVTRCQHALLEEPGLLARLEVACGWSADAIKQLGLGRDRGRITFPLRDRHGSLVGLVRYLPKPARGEEPKMLAEPGSRRELFPAPETVEEGDGWLLLVEGEPDVVAARSIGFAATACPGANGWNHEWNDRFVDRRVVVVADTDPQGRRAAREIADNLANTAAELRLIDFGDRERGFDLSNLLDELDAASEPERAKEAIDALIADAQVFPIPRREHDSWSDLLEDITTYVRRFVVLSDAQVTAVALWIAHTHALDAAETTPYLAVTSAEKRSGKSRLLEILERLAANAMHSVGVTEAAIFRSLVDENVTLLLDETDAIFSKRGEREGLRGLINAGYRRGAIVPRCVGDSHTVERFPVFCAKALAGIGRLPDTIADRSIPIRLQRAAPGERPEQLRWREQGASAAELHRVIARLASVTLDELRDARPNLPDGLHDRAADGWEPLFAIADSAGGEWSERARSAALELSAGVEQQDESWGIRLLMDIRSVFDNNGVDRIPSMELAFELSQIEESPWGDWKGRAFDARALAKQLERYDVKPKVNRVKRRTPGTTTTPRSYTRHQFEDLWRRYLPALALVEEPVSEHDAELEAADPDDDLLF